MNPVSVFRGRPMVDVREENCLPKLTEAPSPEQRVEPAPLARCVFNRFRPRRHVEQSWGHGLGGTYQVAGQPLAGLGVLDRPSYDRPASRPRLQPEIMARGYSRSVCPSGRPSHPLLFPEIILLGEQCNDRPQRLAACPVVRIPAFARCPGSGPCAADEVS